MKRSVRRVERVWRRATQSKEAMGDRDHSRSPVRAPAAGGDGMSTFSLDDLSSLALDNDSTFVAGNLFIGNLSFQVLLYYHPVFTFPSSF
jgi:hypothetical protein